ALRALAVAGEFRELGLSEQFHGRLLRFWRDRFGPFARRAGTEGGARAGAESCSSRNHRIDEPSRSVLVDFAGPVRRPGTARKGVTFGRADVSGIARAVTARPARAALGVGG